MDLAVQMQTQSLAPEKAEVPLDFSKPARLESALDLTVAEDPHRLHDVKKESKLTGGWVQVNNTLVPYVRPEGEQKLLPLSVLRKAAGVMAAPLPADVVRRATVEESDLLNERCNRAGVNFIFVKHTKLVTFEALLATRQADIVQELPADNPFTHAEYHGGFQPAPTSNPGGPALQTFLTPGFSLPLMQPVPMQVAGPNGVPRPVMMRAMTGARPLQPTAPTVLTQTPGIVSMTQKPKRRRRSANTQPTAPNMPPPPNMQLAPPHLQPKPNILLPVPNNRQPTLPNTQAGQPAPPKLQPSPGPDSIQIRPFQLHGRPISCLVEKGFRFALLEAVSRVFFPESSMKAVQYAIEKVLRIPTRILTMQQEKAFIAFYNLPTKILRCRVMVDIDLISENLTSMKVLLKESIHLQKLADRDQIRAKLLSRAKHTPTSDSHLNQSSPASVVPTVPVLGSKQVNQQPSAVGKTATSGRKRSLEDTISHLKGVH